MLYHLEHPLYGVRATSPKLSRLATNPLHFIGFGSYLVRIHQYFPFSRRVIQAGLLRNAQILLQLFLEALYASQCSLCLSHRSHHREHSLLLPQGHGLPCLSNLISAIGVSISYSLVNSRMSWNPIAKTERTRMTPSTGSITRCACCASPSCRGVALGDWPRTSATSRPSSGGSP